jgi:hypothetical protein
MDRLISRWLNRGSGNVDIAGSPSPSPATEILQENGTHPITFLRLPSSGRRRTCRRVAPCDPFFGRHRAERRTGELLIETSEKGERHSGCGTTRNLNNFRQSTMPTVERTLSRCDIFPLMPRRRTLASRPELPGSQSCARKRGLTANTSAACAKLGTRTARRCGAGASVTDP